MKSPSWATIIAVFSALAGVIGTVLTPLLGSSLAGGVQVVLQAISGLLVLIAGGGATVAVHTTLKHNQAKDLEAYKYAQAKDFEAYKAQLGKAA